MTSPTIIVLSLCGGVQLSGTGSATGVRDIVELEGCFLPFDAMTRYTLRYGIW